MRQRILIIIFLALVIAALIGLNAVSYTKKDEIPDSEFFPNRSSYNFGATGSSVFYSLLAETGNKVTRWQQPVSALLASGNSRVTTLVLIGEPRREVTEEDAQKIMMWVERGGRLVLIDREPPAELLNSESNWKLSTVIPPQSLFPSTTANSESLIDKVVAAKPSQPTTLMKDINSVQPSRLASQISIEYAETPPSTEKPQFGISKGPPVSATPPPPQKTPTPTPVAAPNKVIVEKAVIPGFSPTPVKLGTPFKDAGIGPGKLVETAPPYEAATAPVVHLSNPDKNILVDIPYGQGRILLLSDPYIVSNAGIKLADNAILGINLVTGEGGTIAFDEYHQGFGGENTFLRYFSGTPIPALLAQGFLLVLVLLWTQGKRFARPLPLPAKDRRSKLEYVAAMADLQQSTRAYDLAIENIYSQTKRNMVRLVSADNTVSKKQLAEAVAERSGFEAKDLYILMSKCEDIIAGEPTNARETMNLISQLRALEEKLGFNRTRSSGGKSAGRK